MKKTIAKIMAAAVMLSSVPAVALPSLTAEAGYLYDSTNGYKQATVSKVDITQKGTIVSSLLDTAKNTHGTKEAAVVVSNEDRTVDTVSGKITRLTSDLKVAAAVVATGSYAVGKEIPQVALTGATSSTFKATDVDLDDASDVIDPVIAVGVTPTNVRSYVTSVTINKDGYLEFGIDGSDNAQAAIKNASTTKPVTFGLRFDASRQLVNVAKLNNTTYETVEDKKLAWGEDKNSWFLYVTITGSAVDSSSSSADGQITTDNSSISIPVKVEYNENDKTCEIWGTDETAALITSDKVKGLTLNMSTIKKGSTEYEVVKIHSQTFKGGKFKAVKAEKVKHIDQGAFRKCKRMKKINLGTDRKLRKIHSKAFYDDKKLATIKLDGRNFKEVGSKAFAGVKKNCTIKVKAKSKTQYNKVIKKLKKAAGSTKVKFARL